MTNDMTKTLTDPMNNPLTYQMTDLLDNLRSIQFDKHRVKSRGCFCLILGVFSKSYSPAA